MTDKKLIHPEIGMKFKSSEEVENFIIAYGKQECQVFTRSRTSTVASSYLAGKGLPEELKYLFMKFTCKFSKKRPSEAQCQRSSTYDHGCPSFLEFRIPRKDKTCYEIRSLNLIHENHDETMKHSHAIVENRHLSPTSEKDTLGLFALGAKNKLVKNYLAKEKGKFLMQYDIANLKAKLKKNNENDLPTFMDMLRNEYNCTVHLLKDEDRKFQGLYMSTQRMRDSMKSWPSIIFFDGTYKLFSLGFTLLLLQVQDSEGRAEIVGAAIVAFENGPTLKWVAETFRRENPEASQNIKCFMTDKDMTEREAISEVFPGVPKYLCLFHILKAFSAAIKGMKLETTEVNYCLNSFERLAYTPCSEGYDEIYQDFLRTAPQIAIDYFNKNWHPIRNDWTAYSMTEGNLGDRTNNRLESMNGQIQDTCGNRNTLCGFGRKFFALMQAQNQETDMREAMRHLKKPRSLFKPDSIDEEYAKYVTCRAQIEIHKQLEYHEKMTFQKIDNETQEVEIRFDRTMIKTTPCSCTCIFRKSWTLPCKHIFAVREYFQLCLFDLDLCDPMWTKDFLKRNHPASRLAEVSKRSTSSPSIAKSPSHTSITTTPRRKFATVTERRKELQTIMQDVVQVASLATGMSFLQKRSCLMDLASAWKQGHDVEVTSSENKRECDAISEDLQNLSITVNDGTPEENEAAKIEEIIVPAAIKIRGRPSRAGSNTPIFKPKRKKQHKFSEYTDQERHDQILSWILPESIPIKNVLCGEYLIKTADVAALSAKTLRDSLSSDRITNSIMLGMKLYFEERAFHIVEKLIKEKKRRPRSCQICGLILQEDYLECDTCCLFYDFKCTGLKRHPRRRQWYCPNCS